jgi:transposase
MIVIGADTHKGSHALAAVDGGTGQVRGSREITADGPGHLAAVRWARGLDEQQMWAIEDCRSVSCRLEQALLAGSERVVRVPPQRMGASRKGEREPGKSDEIDTLAVARAVVKDGVDQFPVACLDKGAMEIRLCSITVMISSSSELARSTGCAGIRLSCAPSSSGSWGAVR